ncbi:hypothetical protein [Desulfonatronum thiosulfatophilum]|uniref:hypothetical protein n=1 Tax=Desulfonatronum thiosulfatophilum TaxID=617002 RepID=UPI0012947A2C|nr:hypothetical protein [Desulfonatronum thiosulfatophilum]
MDKANPGRAGLYPRKAVLGMAERSDRRARLRWPRLMQRGPKDAERFFSLKKGTDGERLCLLKPQKKEESGLANSSDLAVGTDEIGYMNAQMDAFNPLHAFFRIFLFDMGYLFMAVLAQFHQPSFLVLIEFSGHVDAAFFQLRIEFRNFRQQCLGINAHDSSLKRFQISHATTLVYVCNQCKFLESPSQI